MKSSGKKEKEKNDKIGMKWQERKGEESERKRR